MPVDLVPFTIPPKALHDLVIYPQFADYVDPLDGSLIPSSEDGDWMIMTNVPYSRPLIELTSGQNVLRRRDATCKLIYDTVGALSARKIMTTELYAATEDCTKEFYQGCFVDWRRQDFDRIFQNVMPILEKAIAADMYTNKYFGDITRAADPTGIWSWNKFDGVLTWIQRYITSGVIPAEQTFSVPTGDLTATQAKDIFDQAYGAQSFLMRMFSKDEKVFYVDEALADAYWDYLVNAGYNTIADRQSGTPTLLYRGIQVKVKKWDAPLTALVNAGDDAHCIILTIKGNFVFATDTEYGEGEFDNEAVIIWYSMDDRVWRKTIHIKAGTEIAAPQFIVFGLSEA